MRIGQLAAQTNVSRDTIRLYEQMGLLVNISRPHQYNNYKEYGVENIERIIWIKRFKNLGFTLKESKEIILARENESFGVEDRNELIRKKLRLIDDKIAELSSIRSSLERILNDQCSSQEKERFEQLPVSDSNSN